MLSDQLCEKHSCEPTTLMSNIRRLVVGSVAEDMQDEIEAGVHQINKFELKLKHRHAGDDCIDVCVT